MNIWIVLLDFSYKFIFNSQAKILADLHECLISTYSVLFA